MTNFFQKNKPHSSSIANGTGLDVNNIDPSRYRVLIVDDDISIKNMLKLSLSRYGYKCRAADSGEAAQCIISEDEQPFDIVITDVHMPGMDGIEFLKWVKDMNPTTRVIMITGYPDVKLNSKAMEYGADNFLIKPFTMNKLNATVTASCRNIISSGKKCSQPEAEDSHGMSGYKINKALI